MPAIEAAVDLAELYRTDETAWLERMSALAADGDAAAMDLPNLGEYLSDMAKRDKRELLQHFGLPREILEKLTGQFHRVPGDAVDTGDAGIVDAC